MTTKLFPHRAEPAVLAWFAAHPRTSLRFARTIAGIFVWQRKIPGHAEARQSAWDVVDSAREVASDIR